MPSQGTELHKVHVPEVELEADEPKMIFKKWLLTCTSYKPTVDI